VPDPQKKIDELTAKVRASDLALSEVKKVQGELRTLVGREARLPLLAFMSAYSADNPRTLEEWKHADCGFGRMLLQVRALAVVSPTNA
jgi:hypothetical protein